MIPTLLRKCNKTQLSRKCLNLCVFGGNILKRNFITQEGPGVFSFGPDLIPHEETENNSEIDENSVEKVEKLGISFPDVKTDVPVSPYYERPTPLIFVSGEALPAEM